MTNNRFQTDVNNIPDEIYFKAGIIIEEICNEDSPIHRLASEAIVKFIKIMQVVDCLYEEMEEISEEIEE